MPETPDPKLAAAPADLNPDLIESILASGQDVRSGYDTREDGWTSERIATFLNTLAQWGIVSDAAEAAGMTRQAAYALRNSAKGRGFQLAWRAALLLARRRIADDLMSRAVNGQVDQIYRDGELWRERRRYDNRLGLALLSRLDRLAADDEIDPAASLVADEFEQFVALVARGSGAADFVRKRSQCSLDRREAAALQRAQNYQAYGVCHEDEIDVSDLKIDSEKGWTSEQIQRGIHAGVLKPMQPHEWEWDWEPPEVGRTRYAIVLRGRGRVGILDV